MEDPKKLNGYVVPEGTKQGASASIDDNSLVTSYQSDNTQAYNTDSLEDQLEVHTQQMLPPQQASMSGRRVFAPFSRRRAMTVSAAITGLVILVTGVAMLTLVRQSSQRTPSASNVPEQQDVAIENGINSKLPDELQGSQESLLVRGDVVTRGDLKVSSGGFVSVIRFENANSNQALRLPNASGTLCLDVNNCSYASEAGQNALQGQVDTLQAQLSDFQDVINSLGQISTPTAGVTELNGQKGAVTLQGSFNRVIVNTSGGVVTLSTPQDLDTNANVQFGNLTLGSAGQVRANTLVQTGAGNMVSIDAGNDMITFIAGGRVFQLPNSGGATQTICTTGATCATGSGTAVILSPGAAQVDGTADASIFINDTAGGHLVHLQSGGVDRFTISNAGNTTIGGSLTISGLANGFVRSTGGTLNVVSAVSLASDVTGTLPLANGGTGSTTALGARGNLGAAASGANSDITSTTALNTITPSGALTIGANSQMFTLQGAGNSSISAGSGANVTTVGFAAPTGVNTITFPALSGTVCLSSGNCAAAGTAGGDLTGSYPNPTIAKLQGTDLNIVGAASGQILIYNGANSRWENASISGDIGLSGTGAATINANAVTTGKIADGNVTNAKLQNSSLTVTAGGGLLNGGSISLGGSATLNIGAGDGITINPDSVAVDSTVCRTTGNCAGVGGTGDVTGSGTANRLAMFDAAKNIVNSTLLQSAGTLTLDSGNSLVLASGNLTLTSGNLTVTGGGSFTGTVSGADATQNDEFVTLLQLNNAIGGVGGGVSSLNTLSGDLDLQGTAGQVIVADNGSDTLTLSLHANVTLQGNTFNGANQLVRLGAGGELPVLDGSNLTNVNAATLQGQNGAYYLDLTNATGTLNIARIADGSLTNAKLQNSSLMVTAGNGLTNGGSVSLGGTTTLNIGAGSGITVNADDIAVDATVARLNANANFTANLQQNGDDVCTVAGNCAGVGGTGDVLQGGNSFGAVMVVGTNDTQDLQLETDGTTRLTISSTGTATFTGSVTATSFSGNGANLTNLDAGNITSGVIASARISGSYTGITGVGTITVGTWNGTAISDAYIQDNITISSSGTVDWQALNNYPAACAAGSAITQLGDTITCQAFATGGDGGVNAIGAIDSQTKSANGAVISGTTLYLQTADASNPGLVSTGNQTFAGNKTFNGSVVLAASQSLTVTGGNTASRPGSPVEGMIYFDTTTKQLLTYTNGKWQADRTQSVIVAASNSSQADKDAADYVADGNTGAAADGDQVQINAALTAASGKKVVLLAGTYTVDASISVPTATTLAGIGSGTVVTIPNSFNTTINIISLPGNDTVVENLMVDQNTANQTSGTIVGISSGGYNNTVANTKHINVRSTGIAMSAGSEATAGVVQSNLIDCTNGDPGASSTAIGISITGSTGQNGSTSTARGNSVNNCGTGIRGQSRVLITDNTIMAGRSAGIDLQSVAYANISDNHVSMLYGNFSNNYANNALTGTSILRTTITGNTFSYAFSMVTLTTMSYSTFSNNIMDDSANLMLYINGGIGNTIAGNVGSDTANQNRFLFNSLTNSVINDNTIAGINLDTVSHHNQVLSNQIDSTGGTTNNRLEINGDNTTVSDNVLYGVGSGLVALRITATADSTYLSNNRILNSSGATFLSDAGTNTIYGGQVNDSSNFVIQPAGTVELMKNTNVTGTLNISGNVDTNGSLTVGNADQFVVNNLGVVTAGTWQGTAITDTYVSNTLTVDSASTVDWQALNNYPAACAAGSAITQLGDTITCQAFATGGDGGVNTIGTIDSQTKSADGAVISGTTLYLQTADATNPGLVSSGTQTFAGNKTFNGSVVVAASQSLTITGGNTGSRPGSPTEGMVYFDTDTDKLLIYSNGKWQADRTDAVLVAASNSSQADKDAADYITDGNTAAADDGDQVQINAALTAAAGRKVVLMAGTYVADATILVPNNTTLSGVGAGTIVELADIDTTDNLIEATGASRTGQMVRDMVLNGRDSLNTTGVQVGIYFDTVGSTSTRGSTITGVTARDFRGYSFSVSGGGNHVLSGNTALSNGTNGSSGFYLLNSNDNVLDGNNSTDNNSYGFYLSGSSNNTLTGNVASGDIGFHLNGSSSNTITGNISNGNTSEGFRLNGSSNNNSFTSNTSNGNTGNGFSVYSSTSNSFAGNTANNNGSVGFYVLSSSTKNTFTGNTSAGNTSNGFTLFSGTNNNTVTGNNVDSNGGIGIDLFGSATHNTVSGNTVMNNAGHGIHLGNNTSAVSYNRINNNTLHDNGGTGNSSGIIVTSGDYNSLVGNHITDSAGTGYAINIFSASAEFSYLADNYFSGTGAASINDAGTNTIHGGQLNASGNYLIQPAGTIELLKNTNVTGTLNISSNVDTNGSLTVGNADQFVISNTGVVTSGTWNGTAVADTYVADTITISSGGSVDWTALQNYPAACGAGNAVTQVGDTLTCGSFLSGSASDYIQNQNASAQSSSNFWISGSGRVGGSLTADTSILTPTIDTATAAALNIGTTNATQISLNKHVIVASSQVLLLTGGDLASRQGTAQPGMVYYDTDTQQLLVFGNGKWQADHSDAILVAASNSTQAEQDAAHYVADGNTGLAGDGDQIEINQALSAAAGKKVVLLPGTYVADATILIPNNTTLAGVGKGTIIELADLDASDNLIENSDTTTGTNITIRDLQLNGRKDLNTAGTQRGISLTGMGGGTGATARQGALITGIFVTSFRNENVLLTNSNNNTISNIISQASSMEGLQLSSSSNNVISGSKLQGNSASGFNSNSSSSSNTLTGNHAQGNTSAGFSLASGSYNTASSNTSIGNSYGFFITSSSNTLTGNTAQGNSSSGFNTSGTNNTFTGNTAVGGSIGFDISGDYSTVTGNTAQGTSYGIIIDDDYNTVSGNNVSTTSVYGIQLNGSNFSVVSGNKVHDSGGASTNNGIYLFTSDSNQITNNHITDSSATTNNYAINVNNATSDTNYVAGNTLGGGSINDAGTGTVYGGQTNSSGNFVIQPAGTVELMKNTSVTGTLNVSSNIDTNGSLTVGSADQFVISNTGVVTSGTWNGSVVGLAYGGTNNNSYTTNGIIYSNGTALVSTGAGTNGQCLLANTGSAPTWGACTASDLQGTYNASSPATILLSDNKDFTINTNDTATDSNIIFNLSCSTCSANGGRFAVQDAGVDVLTVNPNGDIVIGSATNGVTFSASAGYKPTATGTARNSKTILLTPEYSGTVLDAGTAGNNTGTMTSGYDFTNGKNFYKWTTTQLTTQSYDVVVQVPLPKDFGAWDGNTPVTINVRSSTTAANTIQLQLRDTDNAAVTGYDFVDVTPGSANTWVDRTPSTTISGAYLAGDYITLRMRMYSPTNGDIRISNVTLNYLSKF